MQHIDEGRLHEYLDRGGDRDASQQAVTEHLAECTTCRVRLAEAEGLRAAASDILHAASPAALAAPSFETVLARTQAGKTAVAKRPRSSESTRAFAYAATVTLALAAGWIANSLYRTETTDQRQASSESESATQPDDAERSAVMQAEAAPPPPPPPEPAAPSSSRSAAAAPSAAKNAPAAATATEATTDLAAAPPPPPPAAAADARAQAAPLVARDSLARRMQEEFVGVGVAGGRADGDSLSRRPDPPLDRPADWRTVGVAGAARALGGALVVVEGLEVVDVAVAAGEANTRVRVRHLTAAGDTIQILQYAAPSGGEGVDGAFTVSGRSRRDGTMFISLWQDRRAVMVVAPAAVATSIIPLLTARDMK